MLKNIIHNAFQLETMHQLTSKTVPLFNSHYRYSTNPYNIPLHGTKQISLLGLRITRSHMSTTRQLQQERPSTTRQLQQERPSTTRQLQQERPSATRQLQQERPVRP